MKYTEDEILAYARSRIRFTDQQKGKRSVFGLMGIAFIVMFICLTKIIKDKSERMDTNLLLDEKFLVGIAIGILILMSFGAAALAIVQTVNFLNGREIEAYRLLVRLKEESAKKE